LGRSLIKPVVPPAMTCMLFPVRVFLNTLPIAQGQATAFQVSDEPVR